MKTGKAFWAWVTMASIFVALGTMFLPKGKSYKARRIIDKTKKLLGMQDQLLANPDEQKTTTFQGRS